MGQTKRIAMARIAQESNALSPVVSTLEDFKRTHFLEGNALLSAVMPDGQEVEGFVKNAEMSGFVQATMDHELDVELVPLFSAWAVPGGPLSAEDHAWFRQKLRDDLAAAGPLDAVYLSVHGSMNVVGTPEPEADYFKDIRDTLGEDIPLAVTMDLHANLSSAKIDPITILCGYQTNPHRDHAKTGQRAGKIVLDLLAAKVKPVTAWRSLPMLIGGGMTLDFLPPMLGIFRAMKRFEKHPKVLSCNVYMSHLWLDQSEIGWATVVTTDNEPQLAGEIAEKLADMCWAVRHKLPPVFPGPSKAIAKVRKMRLRRKLGTITMCDASDVVGAGAPGDSTKLLKAILAEGDGLTWFFPMRDPKALKELESATVGGDVTLEVGASLDPARNEPVTVSGKLSRFEYIECFGQVATLDLGNVQMVITEGANIAMKPDFYKDRGLRIWDSDVCVVKSFFPFHLYFLPYARSSVYVTTGGTTDFDVWRNHDYARPTWPKDDPTAWRPADRARRGVAS
ncbi:MAG: M81 family metallopeptidase [Myxococcales bacterium]|nr:M81 family metallopeptidase [Myxococcales bacterium]